MIGSITKVGIGVITLVLFCSAGIADPVIKVIGRGKPVENGSLTTSIENGTQFGTIYTSAPIGQRSRTATFSILNDGDSTLTITSRSFAGVDGDKFSLSFPNNSYSTLLPHQVSTFYVTCGNPHDGVNAAVLTINSNDPASPIFGALLQATGDSTQEWPMPNIDFRPYFYTWTTKCSRSGNCKAKVVVDVYNEGNVLASPGAVRAAISTDAYLDSSDTSVTKKIKTSLGYRGNKRFKFSFRTPGGTDPYFLYLQTDPANTIEERSELENINLASGNPPE